MSVGEEELAATRRRQILTELRFDVRRELAETGQLTGEAELTPFMHVPGTTHLRTSILVIWADMLGGLLSLAALRPRVPVTLELDVHLLRPAPGSGRLSAMGKTVKTGRSVHVVESEFRDETGEVFAFSHGSFMAQPDATLTAPTIPNLRLRAADAPSLAVPLGERVGLSRVAPGVAEMPKSDEGLNSSRTMHGGLIALVAEEAALSLAPAGSTLSSLAIRYLSPVRTGPAVATAVGGSAVGGGAVRGGSLYRIEVRDDGIDGRLAALVTARTFLGGSCLPGVAGVAGVGSSPRCRRRMPDRPATPATGAVFKPSGTGNAGQERRRSADCSGSAAAADKDRPDQQGQPHDDDHHAEQRELPVTGHARAVHRA